MKQIAIFGMLGVWGTLSLAGCSQPTDPPKSNAALEGVNYPHSADFKKTRQHGEMYFQSGQVCAKCHGADLSGGQSQVSCKTCHGEAFPHPKSFAKPAHHGGFWKSADAKGKEQCLTCHKPGPAKGEGKVASCYSCHSVYPHTPEIFSTEDPSDKEKTHAPYARSADGRCINCHGANLRANTPNFEKGCVDCHGPEDNLYEKLGAGDTKPQAKAQATQSPERAVSGNKPK